MAKTDLEKEEKRREKIRRENTRRKEKFLETIKDNKKKVGIFKTVNFGQAKLWVILLVIGFVLYKLGLTNGIIGTIAVLSMAIGLGLTLSVAFTRIFNGIRIVTLNEDSIIYSDDKNEQTAYKNLEYFVLKAPGTNAFAYKNNNQNWKVIPYLPFANSLKSSLENNLRVENLEITKQNIENGGEEIFYLREDFKNDSSTWESLGKSSKRLRVAMKKVREKEIRANAVYSNYPNYKKIILKKEGMYFDNNFFPWEKLRPVENYTEYYDLENINGEKIVNIEVYGISRPYLFPYLFNSFIVKENIIY